MIKLDAVAKFRERPVILIGEKKKVTQDELLNAFPNHPIFVCDFYVDGIEQGNEIAGGYRCGRLRNIDHHAPTPRMCRPVSSVNLADEFFAAGNIVPHDAIIVVHHTDADSVLSSGLVAGILPREPWVVRAGFSADHTGERNDVADLLQALEDVRDLECSLRNLELLWAGEALEPVAEKLLQRRREARLTAKDHIAEFGRRGSFFWATLQEKIDSVFWLALLPEASVIMTACPEAGSPRWHIKVRLGQKAPAGLYLNKLGLPDFGARWNAGSSERSGGTTIPPDEYAELLWQKIRPLLSV